MLQTVAKTSRAQQWYPEPSEYPNYPSVTRVLRQLPIAERLLLELEAELYREIGEPRKVDGMKWLQFAKFVLKDSSSLKLEALKAPSHLRDLLKDVILNLSRPQGRRLIWRPQVRMAGENLLSADAATAGENLLNADAATAGENLLSAEVATAGENLVSADAATAGENLVSAEAATAGGNLLSADAEATASADRDDGCRGQAAAADSRWTRRVSKFVKYLCPLKCRPVETLRYVVDRSSKTEKRRRFLMRSIEPDADTIDAISRFFQALKEYQKAAWRQIQLAKEGKSRPQRGKKGIWRLMSRLCGAINSRTRPLRKSIGSKWCRSKTTKVGNAWIKLQLIGEFAALIHCFRREILLATGKNVAATSDPEWQQTLLNILSNEMETKCPRDLLSELLADLQKLPLNVLHSGGERNIQIRFVEELQNWKQRMTEAT